MESVIMVLMLCGCSDHTGDNLFSKDTGYQVEMEADGTAAGAVDGTETKVITASDIEVQNITENLKRIFEEKS